MLTKLTRRHLLAQSGRVMLVTGAGALAAAGFPRAAQAQDWGALLRDEPSGGQGTLKELEGEAYADDRLLAVGDSIELDQQLRVPEGSRAVLSLADGTIFQAKGETVLDLAVSERKTGFFRLVVGAVLSVVPRGNKWLVHSPTATIGIKGTVFYHQIFADGEKTAQSHDMVPVTIPAGVREYFCLCNGEVDYLPPDESDPTPMFTDSSKYHNSFFIDAQQSMPLKQAPQINHWDREIRQLIDLQDGPKHDDAWLDQYGGYGPGYQRRMPPERRGG